MTRGEVITQLRQALGILESPKEDGPCEFEVGDCAFCFEFEGEE